MNLFQFAARSAAVLLVSASLSLSAAAQSAAPVYTVDVEQIRVMQRQGALLLDVREPEEFDEAHAPGSVLIPLGQLQERIAELGEFKRSPVVVICRSGRRSAQAAGMLAKLGFTSLYNVQGGMLAWEQASLPIVRMRK